MSGILLDEKHSLHVVELLPLDFDLRGDSSVV
jgi:hypothetical protein